MKSNVYLTFNTPAFANEYQPPIAITRRVLNFICMVFHVRSILRIIWLCSDRHLFCQKCTAMVSMRRMFHKNMLASQVISLGTSFALVLSQVLSQSATYARNSVPQGINKAASSLQILPHFLRPPLLALVLGLQERLKYALSKSLHHLR